MRITVGDADVAGEAVSEPAGAVRESEALAAEVDHVQPVAVVLVRAEAHPRHHRQARLRVGKVLQAAAGD